MNTFSIIVNGKEIVKDLTENNLENSLNLIRGLVWTSGGSESDIKIKEVEIE